MQLDLFNPHGTRLRRPFKLQLLKWIGNKQRFAHEIASYFPDSTGRYIEPFLGSGAVLGTLAPRDAIGSDVFKPLIEIWQTLQASPDTLKAWYAERWHRVRAGDKVAEYELIKAAYNACQNPADLIFLCRSCYGGVVRFRKADGHMSTPCGIHSPMPPEAFATRVDQWHRRTAGTKFVHGSYEEVMDDAGAGDIVYCDPPYSHAQTILYGAQGFDLLRLFDMIRQCKARGAYVALSIDGTKKSGGRVCELPIPEGLFEREAFVNCGRSMLRRFQMVGQSLESELVQDRLLLTY